MLGSGFTITGTDLNEIFDNRLRPYLPDHLVCIEPGDYGVHYVFKPYAGTEAEPSEPSSTWKDPKLAYEHNDKEAGRPVAEEAEYDLREKARYYLSEVYGAALEKWRKAAHVAKLTPVMRAAVPAWDAFTKAEQDLAKLYEQRTQTPDTDWRRYLAVLVDAQEAYLEASRIWDREAAAIAQVHGDFAYSDYSYEKAQQLTGIDGAEDWDVSSADCYRSDWGGTPPATEKAVKTVKEQNDRLMKIARLAMPTD